jgi:uncharacterized protein YkwD
MNINYLILILSQVLFSQTKLEQAVIKELNLYRKKYGLVALIYDAKSSEMSKYHADYLKKLNENDSTLTKLWLWNNGIGDEGCKYLGEALKENHTLT